MKLRLLLVLILLTSISLSSVAQVKSLQAVKVAVGPHIDGLLDDEAWKNVLPATNFITNQPTFGKPSSVRTEVKVVYDNDALYIGAYLYDNPWQIRWQMNQRDQEQGVDVDYFSVFLDTYKDKQNGFQFLVTARNVQTDARLSPQAVTEEGTYGDLSWDAVWLSKVFKRKDGWTVEMKIPFSAIRFSKKDIQEWGINFLRFTRRNNELSFWNAVNPNENGFVNQFGTLIGLKELAPPLRLSLYPYVSSGFRRDPHTNGVYTNEWLKNGGMDIKYGLNESFTLDATLVPDFGQVISDNVVNNLSPYEVRFQENRPFFTEGTELFNKAGTFYSRRVGRQPEKYNDIESFVTNNSNYTIEKNPSVTKLYNAIKFSGRNSNNLGIGVFNAITQPMYAKLHNKLTGKDSSVLTEPLTNYNIIVLDQALKNRSSITFTNTNVLREGENPDANVSALDLVFYNKSNTYKFALHPRYSMIFDTSNGYNGYMNTIEFAKVSGKLQFSLLNTVISDKYNSNDLGYLRNPNQLSTTAEVSYNLIQPAGIFLTQRYSFSIQRTDRYKPFDYGQLMMQGQSDWLFTNFWKLTTTFETTPMWYNDFFELQTPGWKLKRAAYYFGSMTGSSDARKKLYGTWDLGFAQGPLPNDPYYKLSLSLRYRFGDNFSLEASYAREYDNGQYGYAFIREGNGDPILARRKYAQVTTILSGIYNFTPRMNLVFRSRHYWNRLLNTNFYNVKSDGYWTERPFINGQNVNYNTYNLDLFYTWDFRPGSRIILAWKNWLGPTYAINGSQYFRYVDNFKRIMDGGQHGNEFTLRFIYYLDYQQLRGKNK